MLVEEHEGRRDLGSIEPGTRLIEFSGALNLEHEVSTIYIFHDEKEAVLRKEGKQCHIARSTAAAHASQRTLSLTGQNPDSRGRKVEESWQPQHNPERRRVAEAAHVSGRL